MKRGFSTKGLILGEIVAIPFAVFSFTTNFALPFWENVSISLVLLLIMPALTACLDLNFTGATTFTSRTGVKKEIFRYVPIMAFMAGSGVVLSILLRVIALMRVIKMFNSYLENTLKYHPDRCINCRRCTQVCPRGVFAEGEERVELIQPASCMECGACTLNARPRQYKCRVVLAAHGQ